MKTGISDHPTEALAKQLLDQMVRVVENRDDENGCVRLYYTIMWQVDYPDYERKVNPNGLRGRVFCLDASGHLEMFWREPVNHL